MVIVEFMGPINENKIELDVKNLFELKIKLQEIPAIAKWLDLSAVAVNDVLVEDIDMELKNGDRVVVLPPVCGG
ncbi:MoaD/ThiS family protein [Helicobacter sp. 13S00477-4]|uniref:MoaD/ThiS family protein n=1 Tax=Helicobacter sp. 13S00477-4 TaxID=1905759 RepID=UPI000BA726DF|nr:MoaD/ThiS family protein [Helicobacter sp. 13S00477-4]PAF51538.1 molybdopterin synthase sulfur carrier subunit [Helicobacter sp. 13S00477-4]